jgi:hypothetical protein
MPTNDRPKVGEADPETRRKLLRQKLDEPTRSEGVAPSQPKKKKRVQSDLSLPKPKELRKGPQGKTIDEIVSDAVDNAPKRPIR